MRHLQAPRAAVRPAAARAAAMVLLASLCALGTYQMSIVVDGRRHFWLYEEPMALLRQARALAEGDAGTRTVALSGQPAWLLVMAAFHALGISDAKAALAVHVLAGLLAMLVLALSERLLRLFLPRPGLSALALLLALAACFDVVFWAVNGFDTALLTAAFLAALARVLKEAPAEPGAGTLLLISLLPIARPEAIHSAVALAVLAIALGARRGRAALRLAAALALPVLWLWWRHLSGSSTPAAPAGMVALPAGSELGLRYALRFARSYGAALAVAAVGAWAARDGRRGWLVALIGFELAGVLMVGRYPLPGSPYLAHLVPLVLALAVAAIAGTRPRLRAAWLAVPVALTVVLPLAAYDLGGLAASEPAGTVAGVLVREATSPRAVLGTYSAGALPYFARRSVVELWRIDASTATAADVIAIPLPHGEIAAMADGGPGPARVVPLLRSLEFRQRYLPQPLPVLDRMMLYVRDDSPERRGPYRWRVPDVRR